MAKTTRTYTGPVASGHVIVGSRRIPFTAGKPVEFSDAEAKQLDEEWADPKAKSTPQGTPPETQES